MLTRMDWSRPGRIAVVSAALIAAVSLPRMVAADEPAVKPPPSRIANSQLTLRLDPVQGRATVIDIAEPMLTVLTAAHFLSGEDVGKTIRIIREGYLKGRVVAVSRNPGYRTIRSRSSQEESTFGTLGVDTAIALIRLELNDGDERMQFERIRAAELAAGPIPSRPNQVLTVNIVDQTGQEHVVPAGNHLNPKCLAWGRRNYDTRRGDSGAGVFVMRRTASGEPSPLLIGTVSQTDDRGGIASLASHGEPWLEKALAERPDSSR
jgi:hypothetical protein